METYPEFRIWLTRQGLSDRVVNDTVSRMRRVLRFVNLEKVNSRDELVSRLERIATFRSLTSTVRSQLKRAGELYIQFRGSAR